MSTIYDDPVGGSACSADLLIAAHHHTSAAHASIHDCRSMTESSCSTLYRHVLRNVCCGLQISHPCDNHGNCEEGTTADAAPLLLAALDLNEQTTTMERSSLTVRCLRQANR